MKKMYNSWNLQNSYTDLPSTFYERVKPTQVNNPKLFLFNKNLAKNLNLDFLKNDNSEINHYLSGNKLPNNAKPIAQAYAGHQFGNFTMLGDGRAILLGEHIDSKGKLHDIQLKGSGITAFSRGGDGKATLSSMLREYIISESMFYLNVPTTRSLAVIDSNEKVYRETVSNGGILTRVASSHIRVGTFEYGKYFCSIDDFKKFVNYVINRHHPKILNHNSTYLELLRLTMIKQIDLIIDWIRVGFIHGVMNTDNMTISGETIDYGPCAFINEYNPKTVFSSIDKHGRYAFGNQHEIAYWNLSIFAGTVLPFIEKDKNKAVELAQNILNQFPIEYSNRWYKMICNKLGLLNPIEEDKKLVSELLKLMEYHKADYTNTFAALTLNDSNDDSLFLSAEFKNWKKRWYERVKVDKNSFKLMQKNNPIYIPRNFQVESALQNAITGNKEEINKLLDKISNTYNYEKKDIEFDKNPTDYDKNYKTYCGT